MFWKYPNSVFLQYDLSGPTYVHHTLVFIKFRHKQQLLSQTQGHQCHSLISSPKAPKVLPPIMHEHNEE